MVFHQSIHDVADNYALVKGGTDLLDRDTEKVFVDIRRAPTGFEALTDDIQAVKNVFGNSVVIENASLEDIMYYLKGDKQHV